VVYEAAADQVQNRVSKLVPGLLQAAGYTRALFAGARPRSARTEDSVEIRQRRQRRLT
jgi:hypothetical protein